jgi:hypothetical protein
MECEHTNSNGTPCQRRTWLLWLGVIPLCDAHFRQCLAGRPLPLGATHQRARMARLVRLPGFRDGDMATHANRRPTMAEVRQGWLLDLGEPYGWATVTKVALLPPPVDGVPRVRVSFLTDAGQRPQHVTPRSEPCYPYRRPQQQQGAA